MFFYACALALRPAVRGPAAVPGMIWQGLGVVAVLAAALFAVCWAKLRGSIGEGSNHSHFLHQSSVKIGNSWNPKKTTKSTAVKIQCILLEN